MYETIHCVALRTIRYSDSRSILSAWTAEHGFMSFAMPDGRGREAMRRRAITMPLSTFEAVCDIRPGRDIYFLRDMRPMKVNMSTSSSPSKLAMALFLAEIFEKTLRNYQTDKAITLLIFDCVEALDSAGRRGVANFAIWTLYRLTEVLGIAPDMASWHRGAIFDFENGCWHESAIGCDYAEAEKTSHGARIISRLNRNNIEWLRLARETRRQMLDAIFRYYELHYVKLLPLNSLNVVYELF